MNLVYLFGGHFIWSAHERETAKTPFFALYGTNTTLNVQELDNGIEIVSFHFASEIQSWFVQMLNDVKGQMS